MTTTDRRDLYDWAPIGQRTQLLWPGTRPVGFAVVILVEHVDETAPATVPGASSLRVPPNLLLRSHREYGHRVGIFRLLTTLRDLGVPISVAMDAGSAQRYPFVVESCLEHGADFIAHGQRVDAPLSETMTEDEELRYIQRSRQVLAEAVGRPIVGWFGPEQCESSRTPVLLDRLGFEYLCDWPNDEQPYVMRTLTEMVSVPTTYPLDDVVSVWGRASAPSAYTREVISAFDVLAADGAKSARSMVLVVRPWLSGRAFQIEAFASAVRHVRDSGLAWLATVGEIAETTHRQLGSADRQRG